MPHVALAAPSQSSTGGAAPDRAPTGLPCRPAPCLRAPRAPRALRREHTVGATLEGSLEAAREVGQGLGAKLVRDAKGALRGAYNAAADRLPEPPGR
jgi:hypothetical protein